MRAARDVLHVGMGKFFSRNIDRRGRLLRAAWGAALILLGWLVHGGHPWICVGLILGGVFAFYEAARGWCLMRACGIKTKF